MSSVARYVIVVAVSGVGAAAAWTSVLANRVLPAVSCQLAAINCQGSVSSSQSPAPRPEPRGPSPEPRAPSLEARAPSPEPRAPTPEPRAPRPEPQGPSQVPPRGQTTTRLPDGGWLIVGGEVDGEPAATATIVDATGAARTVPLGQPRAWHSATILADGTVLIAGGTGRGGQVVAAADVFDPATGAFVPLPVGGSATRTGHTATLLTDGRVLVFGGTTPTGALAPAEVWAFADGAATARAIGATGARSGHTATLLADGRVLLAGGITGDGAPRDDAEVFDPATATIAPAVGPADDPGPTAVVETQPADLWRARDDGRDPTL